MEAVKFAGLSKSAGVAASVAALFASMVSVGLVVGLFASASGELGAVVAQARAAPAASAAVAVEVRKAGSG
ncbi:MAG: hypothetical protein JNM08_14130 [Rubrivivax sp.]|nr:hypothetical protein [Rubrivivax sp.]